MAPKPHHLCQRKLKQSKKLGSMLKVYLCVSILCPTVNQSPGLEINGMLRLCNDPAN